MSGTFEAFAMKKIFDIKKKTMVCDVYFKTFVISD